MESKVTLITDAVDSDAWTVKNGAVGDEAIYQQELENIFRRTWLYVGHESQIPKPGMFITNFMAEDAVIVTRTRNNAIRVFLNKCLHRGNQLCLYDHGEASLFKCSYHGWTYNNEGELYSVPLLQEAYFNELDKNKLGLPQAHVATYGGMIFASWDPVIDSLDQYLGEMRWYLDKFLFDADDSGQEVVPGLHRYVMTGNWKLQAENFSGDHYHFPTAHQSTTMVRIQGPGTNLPNVTEDDTFCIAPNFGKGPGHGFVSFYISDAPHLRDLATAEELGDDVVAWITERRERINRGIAHLPIKPNGWNGGTVFPNLSLIGASRPLYGTGILQAHPRGPFETEVWQWCMVDKSAPQAAKEWMVKGLASSQSVAGMVGPDDGENFSRITSNTRTHVSKDVPFDYTMGLEHQSAAQNRNRPELLSLPGLVSPGISESNQRDFYRYWLELMDNTV